MGPRPGIMEVAAVSEDGEAGGVGDAEAGGADDCVDGVGAPGFGDDGGGGGVDALDRGGDDGYLRKLRAKRKPMPSVILGSP